MPQAELPPDEAVRIAALESYEILDTGSDWRFDSLVRLTAELYDVPITAISLVDQDRQWFKARTGLDMSETPRSMAFCAHAILDPGQVMVVEDAALDPRFADNPFVTEGGVRFYAGAPIRTPEGQPLGTLCIVDRAPRQLDATARRRLSDLAGSVGSVLDLHRSTLRLKQQATHDKLTGLANRALFEPSLAAAVELAQGGGPGCALLYLDLDRFKAVNDTMGHAAGDAVLVEAALRLRGQVRGSDLVVRLGGDEFAIVMTGKLPPSVPRALGERICAVIAQPFQVGAEQASIGASVGVACCPADAHDPAELMRAADQALYAAKAAGRGRVMCAADLARAPAIAAPRLAEELRHGLAQGRFVHRWQPLVLLETGRIAGHQALPRWDRPGQESAAAPGTPEVDAWSLNAACSAAALWPAALHVAVPLSPQAFAAGDLPGRVADALARTGLPAGRLVLELHARGLTERGLIDAAAFAEQVAALRGQGVRLSIDDFGVGSASLDGLTRFGFERLKLDRGFVRDLTRDKRADAVARAVLALAGSLGMQVCADGVDTPAQLQFLRQAGCQMGQGALFGEPAAQPQFAPPEAIQAA